MIPKATLFRFQLQLRPMPGKHVPDGSLSAFRPDHELPVLSQMDGTTPWATWMLGWSRHGLSVGMRVQPWLGLFTCDPKQYWQSDGLRLFVDTRFTGDVQRATRFCQQLYLLPTGGGDDGKGPLVGRARIMRAREEPPDVDLSRVQAAVKVDPDRQIYALEAFLPAATLVGFDPSQIDRIGLFLAAHSTHLGRQTLSVGEEHEYWGNPACWAEGVLASE